MISQVWRLEVQEEGESRLVSSEGHNRRVSSSLFFWACKWPPSCHLFTQTSLCASASLESVLCVQSPFSYKDTSQIRLEPTLWPHFNLITSLKALSPQTATLGVPGVTASTYKCGRDRIQPVTPTKQKM